MTHADHTDGFGQEQERERMERERGMLYEDEMKVLVPRMPDHRNGIRKQDEMIREGYGFGPLLRQTQRNDVARK